MSSLLIQKIGKNQARGTKRRKTNDGTTVEEEKRPEEDDEEEDDKMIDDLVNNGNKPEQIQPKHSKIIGTRANTKKRHYD